MTATMHTTHAMQGLGRPVHRVQPATLGLIALAHVAALWAVSRPSQPVTLPEVPAMTMVSVLTSAPAIQRIAEPTTTPRTVSPKAVSKPPAPTVISSAAPAPTVSPAVTSPTPVTKPAPSSTPVATPSANNQDAARTSTNTTADGARQAATPTPTLAPAAAVTAPRFDADYLDNPRPAYPPLSRKSNEQGKVVLQVAVDASGAARQVDVRSSSGFDRLDRAAVAAVSRWRFVPARQGSEAVAATVLVPIVFSFKD